MKSPNKQNQGIAQTIIDDKNMKFAMILLLFYTPSGHLANKKQLQEGIYKKAHKWWEILLIMAV